MSQGVTHYSTVTSNGRVTIPAELRRALGIKPGWKVAFELVDGQVRLRALESVIAANYGAVKPISKPEDFRKLRREFEEGMAEEAAREG